MFSFKKIVEQIKTNKKNFVIYSILRLSVLIILIRTLIVKNYEASFVCILSLILFLIPAFIETNFHIDIPNGLEITIYLFIYAAEILGELGNFYTHFYWWDTMLHTINGFICAAVGFSLVDLLNKNSKEIHLTPLYLSVVAFCFSMTIGTLWEFGEYALDHISKNDAQRDIVIKDFTSYDLDDRHLDAKYIGIIDYTEIFLENGETIVIEDGYLDVGLNDTIKDMFVNFVGAIIFSIIGYFYVEKRRNKIIIDTLVPRTIKDNKDKENA